MVQRKMFAEFFIPQTWDTEYTDITLLNQHCVLKGEY